MSPRAGRWAKPAALVKPMSIPGYEHKPPQSLEGRKPDHDLDQPRCMSCQVRARLVLRPNWLRCRRTDARQRPLGRPSAAERGQRGSVLPIAGFDLSLGQASSLDLRAGPQGAAEHEIPALE
jgi:hypothetical protein